MSSEEPVSAYSVFKAGNIKARKKQSARETGAKRKDQKEGSRKKLPYASHGSGVEENAKNHPKISSAVSTNKKKGGKRNTQKDRLHPDDEKKLSKNDRKKNQVEGHFTKELEKDNNLLGEEEDSFDSECSEEEKISYTAADASSDESTISKSGSYSDTASKNEDNEVVEALKQATPFKAGKKRKNSETTQIISNNSPTNGSIKAKRPKKAEEVIKPASRKSVPVSNVENPKKGNQHSKKNSSLKTPNKLIPTLDNVKLGPLTPPLNIVNMSSIDEGKRAFKWLLNPVSVEDFFDKYWEQRACLIKRQQDSYFKNLISFSAIDQMLLQNYVEFTKNIDITSYKNGVRQTLNPEGRALPPVVWEYYGDGCSIRLLNPQTFDYGLYVLCSTMQEYFHCLVGANAYLTPPNSQGFAPHYDDIEAFVLQIEGRKRWKLYKPRSTAEILPRYSSEDFNQSEVGNPVLEEVLEPGDVLYFPRGTIHQACTEPGYHSLHVTLSVYQKQSFADLFEKMMPLILQKAIASNVDLRRGLPLNSWYNAGVAFSGNDTQDRSNLIKQVSQLMKKCMLNLSLEDIIDSAMDQLAKKFQHEALPPDILSPEKLRTVFGSYSQINHRGECLCDYDIDERTNIRLLRANILRLVKEEGNIRIYYYLENSKEYCKYEPKFIEIMPSEAASIEMLIKSYPQYVGVSQLPMPDDDDKVNLATALWETGLLMMEKPFK